MNTSHDTQAGHALWPVQTGMMFQSLWRPRAGFYVQQLNVRFARAMNPELLRRAWGQLTQRHDSLRSRFVFSDQREPEQCFADSVEVPFHFEDWSTIGAAPQRRRLAGFLRHDRTQTFALDAAPLMRIALFKFGPEDFRMVWTSHHLLFDGRSRYFILREFATVYQSLETERPLELAPAPSFRDFLRWIDGENFSKSENYWRSSLNGVSEPTPVGFGAAAENTVGSETRERLKTRFSPTLLRRLESYATHHELTLNTLFQAAWALMLSRYSQRDDVVFGAPRAGRNCPVPDVGSMVGVFVNTLPVRVRVSDNLPVAEFLRPIRENWVDMRPHEQTPLRAIHGWCELPEGQPLFDSLVGFENYQLADRLAADEPWWAGASMELDGWTNFALTIQAYRGSGIEVVVTYDPARFTAAAIRRLSGHLRMILTGFLSPQCKTVGELAMLTVAEGKELLENWSPATTSRPPAGDVTSAFSAIVRSSPEATALIFNDRRMNYRDLERASNAVAAYLHARGVGRGERVGVLLERSFEQVEAILGILKAGAAYVPLDSEYPRERLQFMIRDASLALVLGDVENRGVLDGLPTHFETVIHARNEGGKAVANWVPLEADSDAAAYVIYTSGSTGTPKGVIVPHRGILRLVLEVDYVELGPGRTLLQMAPVSFDASTFELWGALLHGARCVLYPQRRPQISELAQQIAAHGVDTLWLTATLFNLVIDEAPEILRSVRQLLAGGETLSPAHVAKALAALPETQLINGYGPTETTTFACCHRIPRDGFDAGLPVPIGRPIGNTTAYVLDRSMRLAPVGAEGELFIGGAGVALGYLNRPELTAERFVPDPFSTTPEARLYRTGDIVRWRDDGLIEFRGRTDDQVKIRGFRVEPGEIARALQQNPAVKQAAVLALDRPVGGKALIAFYTTESGATLLATDLEQTISARLPAYMVPASFTFVERMPLTINGKVDRTALLKSAPSARLSESGNSEEATPVSHPTSPQTLAAATAAEKILNIFREVLNQPGARPFDSFFDLGGHSLLATKLLHRIEQSLTVPVPYHVLFENPTARKLAGALSVPMAHDPGPQRAALIRRPKGGRHRINLYTKNEMRYLRSGIPRNITRSFFLRGALRAELLEKALQWVVNRHEACRTRLYDVGDGEYEREVAPVRAQLHAKTIVGETREEQMAEVEKILSAEAMRKFVVDSFPFHTFSLLRLGDQEHVLVLNFHHVFFDGKSVSFFLRELSAAYSAFFQGEEPGLPAPAFQMNDLMLWTEEWLAAGGLQTLENYWRSKIGNLTPLRVPIDSTVEGATGITGSIVHRGMGKDPTTRARQVAKNLGTTFYGFNQSVANALMHSFGNDGDVYSANMCCMRRHPSAEGVIGNFSNMVVVRTTLAGNPTFREMVGRTRRAALEALGHRGFPFPQMRALAPESPAYRENPFRFYLIEETSYMGLFTLPGIEIEPIARRTFTPSPMLVVQVGGDPAEMIVRVLSRPEFFSLNRSKEILQHFELFFRMAADDPDRRLNEFPAFGG